jgi:hypothetical protein
MDHSMMVHLFRCVVEIVNLNLMHRQGVVKMDALQIPDELNLDEVLTFLDEVRHFLVDVQVDEELRHLLKMDCYPDEVGVELRHLLKMDCYPDEALALAHLLQVQQVRFRQRPAVQVLVLQRQLLLRRVMPSEHQDLHRALLLTLRRVRDQPLHSFWQRSFWQLPS